ncbi:MAG: Crp/Fnr family transcriptional regulator [Proteobacteria bacterium]|nr:Crp/Fnr family transcriptional regulator [Pseudomonadota bacterium]
MLLLLPQAAGVAKFKKLSQGGLLFQQGEQPRDIYYLLAGDIQIVRHASNGEIVVVHRVHGGFFAEASLEFPRYHSDAFAFTDCVVLAIPLSVYGDALDNNAAFRRAHFVAQAREIRKLRSRIERLALPTARARLVHYIVTEGVDGSVELDQPLKALAGELNLSHEALYRTLSGMAKGGVIERRGNVLRLR